MLLQLKFNAGVSVICNLVTPSGSPTIVNLVELEVLESIVMVYSTFVVDIDVPFRNEPEIV